MEEINLKQLERANPIIQVAVELGLKIQGNVGRCFRTDRHPAEDEPMPLFFNTAKNTFFCKTCTDVSGSVIDLVCQCRSVSRDEAVAWLVHRSEFDEQTRKRYHGRGVRKH